MADYKYLRLETKENVGYIRLNNPPFNELVPDMMDELIDAHNRLGADDNVWGVIIASDLEKFFCNGLPPQFMIEADHEGRVGVFRKLSELMQVMYAFEKPEAVCIEGHAMAGGAVLSILVDYRFMAQEKVRFSFTEVAVGLVVPGILLDMIERVTGPQHLRDIAMTAGAFKADEAVVMNLVDEACPNGTTEEVAHKAFQKMFQLPMANVRFMKKLIRRDLNEKLKMAGSESTGDIVQFIGPNFIEGLTAVVERRRPKFSNP